MTELPAAPVLRPFATITGRCRRGVAPALAVIATLLVGAPGASGDQPATAKPGERVPERVADALGGKVSVTQGGLYKVRTRSGYEFTTHGPDHVHRPDDVGTGSAVDPGHGSDLTLGSPERAPACADDPSSDYYTEFLYAYPSTEPNNIEAERAAIQAVVRRLNWLLNAESLASGGPPADLVVRCSDAGEINVSAFPVPGPATFANIVTAAQNAGFANERVDYHMLLDGVLGGNIAGIAHLTQDDRLIADNENNNPPGSGSDYALTAGPYWHTEVPLHELGHNQGAVQSSNSVANASRWNLGHAEFPGDLMSYAGPGTCNGLHPGETTSTFHFDCGWNTYFDSAPEPGEWLESHWNLGSRLNRFIEFPPLSSLGTISGVVRDHATGTPLEGVAITVAPQGGDTGVGTREVRTDGAGEYTVPFRLEGAYTVSAERWGHRAITRTVVVKGGETSDGGLRLLEARRHDIAGTVMAGTQGLEAATVKIEGTPLDVETAGPDGTFSFEGVPAGRYTFSVSYLGCAEEMMFTRQVGGKGKFDFDVRLARDTYGHTCVLRPVQWVDGTTPVSFSNLDDASATVTLPFTFSYYGVDYDTLYVSTNGYVSFTGPSAEKSNGPIPGAASPNGSLYLFWDDLWLINPAVAPPGVETRVRTATRGTAPTREFIVEYSNPVSSAASVSTPIGFSDFELIFYEAGPGSVLFQYRYLGDGDSGVARIKRGASATIGIENADGSDALQFAFNEPMLGDSESVAILFRPPGGGTGF